MPPETIIVAGREDSCVANAHGSLQPLDDMTDDTKQAADEKPEPVPFPIEVTVNKVRVTVTLMLRPGVTDVNESDEPKPSKASTNE
jgi:hypothetical protein